MQPGVFFPALIQCGELGELFIHIDCVLYHYYTAWIVTTIQKQLIIWIKDDLWTQIDLCGL